MENCLSSIPNSLKSILPDDHEHHICSYSLKDNVLISEIRLQTKTEDDATKWLKSFEGSSKTTWRVKRTYPTSLKYVLFKKEYRCHHGQQRKLKEGKKRHMKNTDCPSSLQIIVKRTMTSKGRKSRSADPHMDVYPTVVKLLWNHNHAITIPSALKFRDVSNQTCEKLQELFSHGHSPASALNVFEMDMQFSDPSGYVTKSADRSLCPDLQFCYRLYYKIFNKTYGSSDGASMVKDIDEKIISEYNEEVGGICAKMTKTNDQLIIAICTPLMQRVHKMLKHSGEMVFIDSTGNVDRHGSRIFLLLTHSSSGGLPLGVVIMSNEQELTITEGLQLLKSILPSESFSGNEGPEVFVTDDCKAERKALQTVFPNSTLLLCTFHVLQAVWRWLWEGKHRIERAHRQALFCHVKLMVYAQNVDNVSTLFNNALEDPLVTRYPGFVSYLTSLYERRQVWAQAFRLQLMIRGNHTNNYAEAAMRVLKDSVLQRSKAFNIPQLVDFVLTRLEGYYQRKLLAMVNQRPLKWKLKCPLRGQIDKKDICKTGEATYRVISQTDRNTFYDVDMAVEVCSCFSGQTGAACKHQEAIIDHFNVPSSNFPPTSSKERAILLKIATGSSDNVPPRWLEPLKSIEPIMSENNVEVAIDEHLEDDEPAPLTPSEEDKENRCPSLQDPQSSSVGEGLKEAVLTDYLKEHLNSMFTEIQRKLLDHPDMFSDPVRSMLHSYRKLNTDSSLISAMKMFGRYSGINFAKRKVKQKGPGILTNSGPSIGVQPTAIARRRSQLGGRKRLSGGRPTKQSAVVEHGYSKRSSSSSTGTIPKKMRVAAPHSLGYAVSMCQTIGKTHSAK